jgi:hypothetical protein
MGRSISRTLSTLFMQMRSAPLAGSNYRTVSAVADRGSAACTRPRARPRVRVRARLELWLRARARARVRARPIVRLIARPW